ncbi:MAG: 2-amino-4-hydroxy-6-hydroxymethyldihydropteridine diphosphokinase [Prevotella sp.]|nr:2-amino-4-hydroxy-6-hydroxymethyldihydropteridine diphosphokinase [Prevotella sp.]
MEHTVYLGLGSNLGNRIDLLDQACQKINKLIGPIVRQSAYYETEPWGFQSDHPFMNAVVCISTQLSPRQLLRRTQRIERQLGRREKTGPDGVYHDRPIDIDILLYDQIHVDEPDLIIPHPRMLIRPFVMEPLREICPEFQPS